MSKIKLNNKIEIDLDKLIESRLLVQANSGGGKSWAIRRIIEQAFGKVQIIVLDPEGEFGNLRSKFDFVYAGKGGDAPVESRSASLLARRLLELKASAIIDLYELPPQERKHYVRLFCDTMVNAPKELWHDVLIIIDEAHVFAPEKGESEAMGPVIDLATRGRKRGYCVVLATQRLPKLNKDAAAECNNKLIGRASQDIDRKRAAEELGFTGKEQVLSLRDLSPGEFYAFGPAISREVNKIVIGDVVVKPAKRGTGSLSVAAPSAKVKQILSKLADLPQEAEQEARTISELRKELQEANRKIKDVEPNISARVIQDAVHSQEKAHTALKEEIKKVLMRFHGDIQKVLDMLEEKKTLRGSVQTYQTKTVNNPIGFEVSYIPTTEEKKNVGDLKDRFNSIAQGEKKVLIAISQFQEGITREHLTILTGFKRSTRDAYIQRLRIKGYVEVGNSDVRITDEGIAVLGNDYMYLPTGEKLRQHWLSTLPQGEKKILEYLFELYEHDSRGVTRDEISEATGFKRSTRDAYIQRLATRQLINVNGGMITVSNKLYE